MIKKWLIVGISSALGVALYIRRVRKAQKEMEQKRNLAIAAVQDDPSHILDGGFRVTISSLGEVEDQIHAEPLVGKNVFSTPELSEIFHRCMARALRGGGYNTFLWPDAQGTVRPHVSYSFTKGRSIVVIAQPRGE